MVIYAHNYLCTYAHPTELSEFVSGMLVLDLGLGLALRTINAGLGLGLGRGLGLVIEALASTLNQLNPATQ